ncbi:MAG: hypothetical protein DIU79_09185 [Actinobacteria bacterium]|nr:MAG: hypothetical protein DIU79_09185 [Actinomycetota bacterium]
MDTSLSQQSNAPRAASWRSSLTVGVVAAVLIGASAWGVFHAVSGGPPLLLVQPSVSPSPQLLPLPAAQVVTPTSATPTPTASATPSASSVASPSRLAATRTSTSTMSRATATPPSPSSSTHSARAPQFSARYATTSEWADGFVATIEVTNRSQEEAHFEVRVTYPRGFRITVRNHWADSGDVIVTSSGRTISLSGTRPVPAGGRVQVGFLAGKNSPQRASPVRCTVNGAACRS